jgi:hypothetical protein
MHRKSLTSTSLKKPSESRLPIVPLNTSSYESSSQNTSISKRSSMLKSHLSSKLLSKKGSKNLSTYNTQISEGNTHATSSTAYSPQLSTKGLGQIQSRNKSTHSILLQKIRAKSKDYTSQGRYSSSMPKKSSQDLSGKISQLLRQSLIPVTSSNINTASASQSHSSNVANTAYMQVSQNQDRKSSVSDPNSPERMYRFKSSFASQALTKNRKQSHGASLPKFEPPGVSNFSKVAKQVSSISSLHMGKDLRGRYSKSQNQNYFPKLVPNIKGENGSKSPRQRTMTTCVLPSFNGISYIFLF